jgi:hypothetical protein
VSYFITVVKDAEGARVTQFCGPDQTPDGTFTVYGHAPAEGTSQVGTIGVQLVDPTDNYIAAVSGSHTTVRPA